MDNNILNEEISRISSIMGVNPKLIIEGSGLPGLADELSDAVTRSFKNLWGKRVTEKLTNNFKVDDFLIVPQNSAKIYDDIAGVGDELGVGLDRVALKALGHSDDAIDTAFSKIIELLKNNEKFVNDFYKSYVDSFKKAVINGTKPFRDDDEGTVVFRIFKGFKKAQESDPSLTIEQYLKRLFQGNSPNLTDSMSMSAEIMASKFKTSFEDLDALYEYAAKGVGKLSDDATKLEKIKKRIKDIIK